MSELDHYDYELPKELIAQQPLPHRADARLMVVNRQLQSIEHYHIRDLPTLLQAGDCLVLNNTRVLPARLVGTRLRTGAKWSGLFLHVNEHGVWELLAKTRGKVEVGEIIELHGRENNASVQLRLLAKLSGGAWAAKPECNRSTWEILEQIGHVPLPPYIRGGKMMSYDTTAYQTVFASQPGSVAAPTAGLHFTPELLQRLEVAGIMRAEVTLHVGIGTFRPIAVEKLTEHVMHVEPYAISAATVAQLQQRRTEGGRVVAVGTTAMRTLETASLSGTLQAGSGDTNLFIRPGFQFHTVNALLTNFHLPRSTLLVLVRTFGGDALLKRAYELAIEEEYRFFSYGDAMLIL
jgi:S-adenosylmethionine:tRNA ribosyltransferase-isomerase